MEHLTGGNSNQVARDGKTVLRKMGRWSPFVHALLNHLHDNGFEEAPRFIEIVGDQERLSFIEGAVGNDPLEPYMLHDQIVSDAGRLLRKLHDVTQSFRVPPDAEFMLPVTLDADNDIIGHNDFAPYNCVFRDGRIIGIIDFDTASPTTRLWDIAYAVYRFVPLMTDAHCRQMGYLHIPDRGKRLNLFCDAYGLEDRDHLIETVITRLEALIHHMRVNNSNLDHMPFYEADIAFIRVNHAELSAAIR